jgi:protein-disulfide isomerase
MIKMKRAVPFIIILVVLAAVVAVAWSLKESAVSKAPSPAPSAAAPGSSASPAATAPQSIPPGAEPPNAVGPMTAVVTLEEFGDFQCPPCGMLHPVLKTMKQEFGDKIRVIFRQYPLVPSHPHALSAARAAEAAGRQGKFFEMHDQIFENQKAWDKAFDARPIFESYAQKIGLDPEKYRKDLTSEVVEQRIFQDGKRAHALGVQGTPTVFMNGREIPFQSLEPGRLRVLISNEIAAAGR